MALEKTGRRAQKRSRIIRWSVLGVVLVGMTALTTAHQYLNTRKPPGVDALCPFGGLETLFSLITGAGFVEKTAASALVLFAVTIGLALVYRRSFCGQLCPLGALQGIFGALRGRVVRKRPQVPASVDRWARFLKYGVLAFFTLWTWQAAALVMRPYDPWAAYAHITSDELLIEFGVGVLVLVVSLVGSFAYDRFFCKYLCPMGAFLGLFSKLSFFGIKRDADACIDCGACDKACPMNIPVSTADVVTNSECISCNECVNSCPAAGALEIKASGARTFSPALVTGLVALIVALSIGVSSAAGAFSLRMPTLADTIEQQGGTPGELGGEFDSSLIKGRMSLQEISEGTGIPAQEFIDRYGVPEGELGVPMKDIKDEYGFTPEEVRAWVDERLAQ
jgi:ferredoxin